MRKYNLNGEQFSGNSGTFGNSYGCYPNRGIPFFDIPCLYYPQYPYNWGYSNCENAYSIFGLSAPDGSDSNLEFHTQVQDGRCITLDSDGETIHLQPGKLYLVTYHVSTTSSTPISVIPVVDGISDLCNASHLNGGQSVSSTFLLPVVETVSTLQLQLSSIPEQVSGSLSIVALASL